MVFLCAENLRMHLSAQIAHTLTTWMEANPSLNTLKKVAAKAKVGFGTVQRAKNGDGNLTVEKLEKIAAAFGRTPIELMLADAQPVPTAQPLRASEPDILPFRLRAILDVAETMSAEGQAVLLGRAQELAHLYPRPKGNSANSTHSRH